MCGICGFVGSPEGIARAAMLDSIQHRGPDDVGEFNTEIPSGEVWLGARRLAILDLSPNGNQPITTDDGRLTIVFNGEIYNFHEVRKMLEALGHRFQGTGDTETVLHAWEAWGSASLDRLSGMFAFAIWDQKENALFLARDRLGEKPLYYYVSRGRIVFGSEVRCLLASDVIPRTFDDHGLDSFLTFGAFADPYTAVQDVRALEAGYWGVFKDGRLTSRPYWSLSAFPESPNGVDPQEAAEQVGGLVRDACRSVMVSDVPVGVLLSGGIDSSSMVALLTEMGHDLTTFSVLFEGPDIGYSEEKWSSMVAERFATDHRAIVVTQKEASSWVLDAVRSLDQPSYDGVNTYLVSRAIASAGLKVAVTGQGSDELFLGYGQRKAFPLLYKASTSFASRVISPLQRATTGWDSIADTKVEKILQLHPLGGGGAAAYLANHSIFSYPAIERLRGEKRPTPTRFIRHAGGITPLGRMSRFELSNYLRYVLLRDGDQMSMANSLELRSPFVDHRLVETVASFPTAVKVRSGHQKPLLVEAVGSSLPREVVDRPKQGFLLPFDRWLRDGVKIAELDPERIGLSTSETRAVERRFVEGRHWSRYWALQVLSSWASDHRMSPS